MMSLLEDNSLEFGVRVEWPDVPKRFNLFGYGGHAKEVAAQLKKTYSERYFHQFPQGAIVKHYVDDEYVVNGCFPISEFNFENEEIHVAVGDSNKRKEIVNRLPANTRYATIVHPEAHILENVEIGEGSFIGIGSVITTNVKIGKHAILNRHAQVGHDCKIGDFFSMMPNSVVSGNVGIRDCVYMGSNSSIKENIHVCSYVRIGMNCAVVKTISQSGTYVGVPAKRIK